MSKYEAGIRHEYKVRDYFRENGYRVTRGAGSKSDHGLDLYASKPGDHVYISCKVTGIGSPRERALLIESASWVGAVPVVAEKNGSALILWQLTGPGPQDRKPFSVDFALEASMSRHPAGKGKAG